MAFSLSLSFFLQFALSFIHFSQYNNEGKAAAHTKMNTRRVFCRTTNTAFLFLFALATAIEIALEFVIAFVFLASTTRTNQTHTFEQVSSFEGGFNLVNATCKVEATQIDNAFTVSLLLVTNSTCNCNASSCKRAE